MTRITQIHISNLSIILSNSPGKKNNEKRTADFNAKTLDQVSNEVSVNFLRNS